MSSVSALFCDDIRIENNGKILIVGAYSFNISVPVGTPTFTLSAFIRATHPFDEEIFGTLEVKQPDTSATSGAVPIAFDRGVDTENCVAIISAIPISAAQEGDIELWVSICDEPAQCVERLPLRIFDEEPV